jgi:hypothetical protein
VWRACCVDRSEHPQARRGTADQGKIRLGLFRGLLPSGPAQVREIYPAVSLDNADCLPRSWRRKSLGDKDLRRSVPDRQAGIYCKRGGLYGPA